MRRCGFYVVADATFYVGAVATLNSLRVLGHDESAFVLDAGLSEAQRHELSRTARIVPLSYDLPPRLAKWVAPLAEPSEVMVILDADIAVVHPLHELLEQAARGHVVAFADFWIDRFHDAWAGYLGVDRLRRRAYVNSGFFALPPGLGVEVLERLRAFQTKLAELGYSERRDHEDPSQLFAYPDQDAWNAVLSAVVPDEQFDVRPHELAPFPQDRVTVVDEATLDCRLQNGRRPFLVHQIGLPKPWLGAAPAGAYTRLLPRLLCGEDVAVRLDADQLPLRLRPGPAGGAERLRLQVRERSRRRVRRLRGRVGTALKRKGRVRSA